MSEPSEEELLRLHRALLVGDPVASARLAELLLPVLRRRLEGLTAAPGIDPHAVDAAINWSLVRYLEEPRRYDPEKGLSLVGYLAMDARGDVRNEQKSRRARQAREEADPDDYFVEVSRGQRNEVEEGLIDRLDPFGVSSELVERALQELGALDPRDLRLLRMIAEGVRSTAAFAEVLNISHLPLERQRAEVKRQKDRLKKQVERLRDRLK